MHVRAEHEYRKEPQGIAQAQVPSGSARTVQLSRRREMAPGAGPSSINRIQRQRQVMLTANMAPGHSAQTVMDNLLTRNEEAQHAARVLVGLHRPLARAGPRRSRTSCSRSCSRSSSCT